MVEMVISAAKITKHAVACEASGKEFIALTVDNGGILCPFAVGLLLLLASSFTGRSGRPFDSPSSTLRLEVKQCLGDGA